MSFADGHADRWSWKDLRTIELMTKWDSASRGDNLNLGQDGNPDLVQVQQDELALSFTPVPLPGKLLTTE